MWTGHVARMGREELSTGFWLGCLKARDHWKHLGLGGRIKFNGLYGDRNRWD